MARKSVRTPRSRRRNENLGKLLRNHRMFTLGDSLRDCSARGGVAFGFLSDVERGIKDPMQISIGVMADIAKAYNIKLEAILRRLGVIE